MRQPYHFHVDLKCEYSPSTSAAASAVTAHSPLIGVALDGYGLYGAWESAGTAPTLDACNGHAGVVPGTASVGSGNATAGITGLASSSVYHYHTSSSFPYTIGCYGGGAAVTTEACKALYPNTCKTYVPTYASNGSMFFADDWCPCGNGGAKPATAINTVPSDSGATCYSSTSPNSHPPQSACTTCTTCSLSLLSGGSTPSTQTQTTSTPSAAPRSAATAAAGLLAALAALA